MISASGAEGKKLVLTQLPQLPRPSWTKQYIFWNLGLFLKELMVVSCFSGKEPNVDHFQRVILSKLWKKKKKANVFLIIKLNDKIYLGSGLLWSHRLKDYESLICTPEFKSHSLLGGGRAYAGGPDVSCLSCRSLISAAAGTTLKSWKLRQNSVDLASTHVRRTHFIFSSNPKWSETSEI